MSLRSRFVIDCRFEADLRAAGLDSPAAVARCFGEETLLVPRMIALPSGRTLPVFFKRYRYRDGSWEFFARASKAACEFRNYGALEKIGLPTAQAVAWGETRDRAGRLVSAFIITRAILDAVGLIQFVQRNSPDRSTADRRWLRDELVTQVARQSGRMHRAGFFHHDLVGRNLLVTWNAPQPPRVWWIDCPRGGFDRWSPWRRRRWIKDLASLDKSGAKFFTRTERLRFLLEYLGTKKLDAAAKRLARDVQSYRKHRWPEDWEGG